MPYLFLAEALVALHFLFILFVVLGAWLTLLRSWIPWLHLPAACWGAYIEFSGQICPLTPLENHLRNLAGEAGYDGGFITHYLLPVIYPAGLTQDIQWLLGGGVIGINVFAYAFIWHRQRKAN